MKRLVDGDLLPDERSRIAPLSGRKARRFRLRWAAAAGRTEQTIRTIKFPLEVPQGQRIDSRAFGELHATLRELRPGTLPWLLLTVHASGFRIFSKSDEVTAFLNSRLLGNDVYRVALIGATGIACPKLDPINLYLRFRTVPRPPRGTVLPFAADVIAREYMRYFSPTGAAAPDPALALLISRLARRLERLGGWASLASDPSRAFEAWDDVMRSEGIAVPALAPRVRRFASPAPSVAKATIAHDPCKPRVSLNASDTLPLLVSTALAEARMEGLIEAPALTKRVLQLLLTENYAGLSWLWGSGLLLLKSATISACRGWFGVEADCAAALTLAARSIPADRVFGNDGYASYRADVGGMLAGWIRSYITGLLELDRRLIQHPDPSPDIGVPTAPQGISAQIEEAQHAFGAARRALDRLLGMEAGARGGEVESIERYSHLIEGIGAETSSLSAMVRMSAPPDPEERCRGAALRFAAQANVMSAHAERLLAWSRAQAIPACPFERLAQERLRRLVDSDSRKKSGKQDALLDAIRQVLDRFGRIARRHPGKITTLVMAVYDELKVFGRKKDLHRYFLTRQGALYEPRFDRSFRAIIPVDGALRERRARLLTEMGAALRSLRRDMLGRPFCGRDFSALVDLEHVYFTTVLWGLPESLPAAVARPAAEADVLIPGTMQRQLQAGSVSANVVRQLFNLYATQLRELTAVLAREGFLVRHAFARSRDNALVYVPKDVAWKPPARLHATTKPIGLALVSLGCREDDVLSPPALLARAAALLATEPGMSDLLAQSPHDWYYTGFKGGVSVTGLSLSKAGAAKRSGQQCSAFRLIGPSSAKTSLDRALLGRRAMIGDVRLICDRHFVQRVEWNGSGALTVDVRELEPSLHLGVPLLECGDDFESPLSMDRYVSVDLGEYGVGWAAFDARTHKELAHGFEPVDSLRSFARQLKAMRRPRNREVRYLARFDHGREDARKRVVGEIMHAIDSLLSKFRAFPVFETRALSSFSGGKEIERIHLRVVETYTFVDWEHAIRRRRTRWCGSQIWTHPYLRRNGREPGESKPLNLFPGTVVSARGNSQTCSHCGRNAVETVRGLTNGAMPAMFVVADHGRVELPNGTITLLEKSRDRSQRESHRRRGEHASRDTAYPSGPIAAQRLIAAIKDNIRRPPVRKGTRSSSHSRYFCVYADCAACDDADVNAARNIARRFRDRLFGEGAPDLSDTVAFRPDASPDGSYKHQGPFRGLDV